jgi:hypothetical protein
MGPLPGGPKFNPTLISTYAKPTHYTKRSGSAALMGWDAAQVCAARAADGARRPAALGRRAQAGLPAGRTRAAKGAVPATRRGGARAYVGGGGPPPPQNWAWELESWDHP